MVDVNKDNTNKIMELFHEMGKLDGRVGSIENGLSAFEERVEKRLNEISNAVTDLLSAYNKGKGIKLMLGAIIGGILLIPALHEIYTILFK